MTQEKRWEPQILAGTTYQMVPRGDRILPRTVPEAAAAFGHDIEGFLHVAKGATANEVAWWLRQTNRAVLCEGDVHDVLRLILTVEFRDGKYRRKDEGTPNDTATE